MKKNTSVGKYLLWWTVALFSNAGVICFTLSLVFAFSSADRNRANFFKAVLLFKLIFLLIGAAAVLILALRGFSYNSFLNSIDIAELFDDLRAVISF